ncbi:hypothetical protein MTR_5g086100 [Medicago truncatula]|uniref:Uncharacterized protein n=1 Tax=Medicago truncatula TaxID=3880 RepID=G7K7M9_MEDTR|nr:hypothetical protein MTR_5g086100 [Medicago truncatula]
MAQLSTWSGQASILQKPAQPRQAIAMSHYFSALTWVPSWHYPTQQTDHLVRQLYALDCVIFYSM